MAQVEVEVNGRPYRLSCQAGQEDHLRGLVRRLDEQAGAMARSAGAAPPDKIMLMAALMIADQLSDAEAEIERLKSEALSAKARAKSGGGGAVASAAADERRMASMEAACTELLDGAAAQMEKIAAKLRGA